MITIFGSINLDLVASVAAIASPGETVMATGYQTFFGGKGANQAVAAARAAGPGAQVAMVGAIGRDSNGDSVAENLAVNGVQGLLQRLDDATGMAFISVDGRGENAITVVAGANAGLRSAHLSDAQLMQTRLLLLQLEAPLAESLDVARRARKRGVRVLWNIAPLGEALDADRLGQILDYATCLVANQHEARQAAALLGMAADDVETIALTLADRHGLTCVVTLGAAGAVAATEDGESIRMSAPQVSVVDTTGAGDTFCGALAVGLSEDLPLDQTLLRAVAAGSLSCGAAGAQNAMPTRAQIDGLVSPLRA